MNNDFATEQFIAGFQPQTASQSAPHWDELTPEQQLTLSRTITTIAINRTTGLLTSAVKVSPEGSAFFAQGK